MVAMLLNFWNSLWLVFTFLTLSRAAPEHKGPLPIVDLGYELYQAR
jgi:hypothetical protein